jgi:hypothetical protein
MHYLLSVYYINSIYMFRSDWLRAGLSGDRIPVGARFFAPVQTCPGAHSASCTMGTGSFRWIESGRGVTLTSHPLLVPRTKKPSRAIPLLSHRAFVACKIRVKNMFRILICSSSGSTVYTTTGIFRVYYVFWLLAGLEWSSTPTLLAVSRHSTHKIYQLLYIQCLLMKSK